MTDTFADVVVTVAPGSGRAARRAGSLLFDPTGENQDLIERFDLAVDDDAAVAAVKQRLIEVEFEVAPLIMIDWRDGGLGLLVFGDTEITSSVVAARMINGAGSGTWIERHLGALELGDSTEAEVFSGDDTDPATDLRLGVVRCGGVRLAVTRVIAEDPVIAAADERPPIPSAPAAPVVATNGHGHVPPAPVAAAPEPPRPAIPAAPVFEANGSSEDVAAPTGIVDPFGNDAAPQALVGGAAAADLFEDAVTEPLGTIDGLDEAMASAGVQLVEATMCSNDHANPPSYALCHLCAVELDAEAPATLIEQPSVGFIRFTNGAVVEVDRSLVIGRKPSADGAHARAVTVDHAEVSRSHIDVKVDGWSVLVTDLGSRNGTWVNPPSDPTPVKLDADVPHLLEHGTTIHLGGPEAAFTYEFGSA